MGFFKKSSSPETSDDVEINPMKWPEEPEMSASFLNRIVFLWLQPMFARAAFLRGHGKFLENDDLVPLAAIDKAEQIEKLFDEAYENYVPKPVKGKKEGEKQTIAEREVELENRLIHALLATVKRRLIVGGIFRFVNTVFQFSFPILLNLILSYYEDVQDGKVTQNDPVMVYYKGYWLSALLMVFVALKALSESAYFHKVNRCSWRVKAAVSSSIYRKSLRLASSEQQKTTLGEIVNLMQVDAAKIEAFMIQIHVLWDGLFQIVGYMAILGNLLGWTCIIGMLLIMSSIPMMGKITGKMFGYNRSMVKYSDQRIKAVNEALQGMLAVKMYTWEDSFAKEIDGFRREELQSLKRIAYLRAFFRSVMSALPIIAAACTFLAYVYGSNGSISASTLFASIVAFDMLRMPLMFYPMALAQYAQAKVSLKRVGLFLGYDEVNKVGYTRKPEEAGEITIENASLYWFDPTKPLPRSALDESTRNSSISDSQHSSSSGQQLSKQSSRRVSFSRKSSSRSDAPDPVATVEEETALVYPNPILEDVNIHVSTGTLCAIVGPVGSGKSTLCSAVLNEAVLGEGSRVALHGSVAYVAQTAWILNKTVRDNILFGLPYDRERYEQVIDACSLRHDISILEDGDQTEIGERGINLSGGQKQRISLARAAYSGADVLIFDDPLSALDPEVAQKVFAECINGLLAGKTRLLVTNNLQFLSECDFIVAFSKHGKIVEQGTYTDLMSDKRGEVTRLLKGIAPSRRSVVKEETVDDVKKDDTKTNDIDAKNLITKEERQTGSVKLNVYLKYIQAGGGYIFFSFIFLTYMLSTGTNVMTSVWVAMWTADAPSNYSNGKSETFYIVGYALLSILLGIMTFIRSYALASFGVRSSFVLHGNVLRSVLKAPMSFFDTTPTGRILSRFSKDMFSVDNEIADFVDLFVFIVLQLIVVMVSIVVITPYFAVVLPFLGYLYIRAMNYFRQVSRETKRLESVARSPVYSQFSETLGGLSTIRAYGKSSKFVESFGGLLDLNSRTIYCNKASDRWLATRLEGIASCVVGLSAFFATSVVVSNGASIGNPSNFASFAGISLSYAVTATGMMQFVVRAFAQVEAAMNSVERITYYTEEIPQEAAMTSKELESDKPSDLMNTAQKVVAATGSVVHPAKEWPTSGSITLTGLKMRYRPETPLVLKGLNVKINAGERVGIVGRTGSGKSSLLLILMRLVEPFFTDDELKNETYKAPLVVDGVDVMRIGLFDLRSKVGIIPQSPVLFSGTIRSNLDPFNNFSDLEIWSALEKCRMKEAVAVMTDGLLSRVAEYGENLSQGQRQLLCLGRAVLKQAHILLLDEATSSVDFETDKLIQTTIREAFKGCTVLTIAHRVNTIMDSDKILVMNDGVVAEFDPPEVLLQNKESIFSEIVSHANGDEEEE